MARKNKGWIKVYRQLQSNPIWTSSEPFDRRSAWIDLLLMVNHEQRTLQLRNGNYITIEAGQCFTSVAHLANRWHWSPNKVRRYLHTLSEQDMCTQSGTPSGTLLTLIKYDNFQSGRRADGTTDGTTDETTDGTTDGTRTRTNIKNYINKNVIKNKREGASDSSFEDEFE